MQLIRELSIRAAKGTLSIKKVKSSIGQSLLVQGWSPIQGPQPDTSRSCKPTDMGPHTVLYKVSNYFPTFAGTSLYCLVTKAHGREQLAQSCYLIVIRPGIELRIIWSRVRWHTVTPLSHVKHYRMDSMRINSNRTSICLKTTGVLNNNLCV